MQFHPDLKGFKMRLLEWRESQNLSRVEAAKRFGIVEGQNPSQNLRNYETGNTAVPVILAPKIIEITGGQVSLNDLADTRRDFLQQREIDAATSKATKSRKGSK